MGITTPGYKPLFLAWFPSYWLASSSREKLGGWAVGAEVERKGGSAVTEESGQIAGEQGGAPWKWCDSLPSPEMGGA